MSAFMIATAHRCALVSNVPNAQETHLLPLHKTLTNSEGKHRSVRKKISELSLTIAACLVVRMSAYLAG